jgi:hypothetical protein
MDEIDLHDMHMEEQLWPTLPDDGDVMEDDDCPPDEWDDGDDEGSYDNSDDGDALASAGFGTDEDY